MKNLTKSLKKQLSAVVIGTALSLAPVASWSQNDPIPNDFCCQELTECKSLLEESVNTCDSALEANRNVIDGLTEKIKANEAYTRRLERIATEATKTSQNPLSNSLVTGLLGVVVGISIGAAL